MKGLRPNALKEADPKKSKGLAVVLSLRKHTWVWAAIIVTVVQLTAIVILFKIKIDFASFLGNRIFDLLNLLSFLPGKIVLLAMLGFLPNGSIRYYAEATVITWVIYVVILGTFLTRGKSHISEGLANEGTISQAPILVSTLKRVWRSILLADFLCVLVWRVVIGPHLNRNDWTSIALGILCVDGAMLFGAYYRERFARMHQASGEV